MRAWACLAALALGGTGREAPIAISEQRRLWVNSDTFRLIRAKNGSQMAEALGHVEALHGPYRLLCDKLLMAEDKREGTATGRVILTRKEEGLELRGHKLIYHENLKNVDMEGEPSLQKVDAQGRTTTATGQRMTFEEESGRGEIIGDVLIRQGGLEARAGRALYDSGPDVLVLTESPVATQGENELKGDKMTLYGKTEKLVIEGGVTGKLHGGEPEKAQP